MKSMFFMFLRTCVHYKCKSVWSVWIFEGSKYCGTLHSRKCDKLLLKKCHSCSSHCCLTAPTCPKNQEFFYNIWACNSTCRSITESDPRCGVDDASVEGCGCLYIPKPRKHLHSKGRLWMPPSWWCKSTRAGCYRWTSLVRWPSNYTVFIGI